MRDAAIEYWALGIVDQRRRGQPIEDSRVELKFNWIEPSHAARQLAGHANAARGDDLLWLIGIDEKRPERNWGADVEEFSAWWSRVERFFEGLAPEIHELNVPIDGGKVVVAIHVRTDRAPFVYRNPAFGNKGALELEVPWREGTSTRAARRGDLLRLLVPIVQLPEVEVMEGWLSLDPEARGDGWVWDLHVRLYVTVLRSGLTIAPDHRTEALAIFDDGTEVLFDDAHLTDGRSTTSYRGSSAVGEPALTSKRGDRQMVFEGSGPAVLIGSAADEPPVSFQGDEHGRLVLRISVIGADREVPVPEVRLVRDPEAKERSGRWDVR